MNRYRKQLKRSALFVFFAAIFLMQSVLTISANFGAEAPTPQMQNSFLSADSSANASVPQSSVPQTSESQPSSLPDSSAGSDSEPAQNEEPTENEPSSGAEEPAQPTPFFLTDVRDYINIFNIDPPTIITSTSLTQLNGDPFPNSPPRLTVGSDVRFTVNFEIPNELLIHISPFDFYEFSLPEHIAIASDIQIDLKGVASSTYATVNIYKDTRKVRITFIFLSELGFEISGSFFFGGTLDGSSLTAPGFEGITIPEEAHLPVIAIFVKPEAISAVGKTGYFTNQYNPDGIVWKVDINKGLDILSNAVVTETFPASTTLTKIEVFHVAVDLNGEVIDGSEAPVDADKYTVDLSIGQITFTNPIESPYRIVHTTTINSNPANVGNVTFTNTATLASSEVESISATASVVADFGFALGKMVVGYNPVTQVVLWTIKYNYNEMHIPQADAHLADTFDTFLLEINLNSVAVNEVTFDINGNPTLGTLLRLGTDYTLEKTNGGFDIVFLREITTALDITYLTDVIVEVLTNTKATNKVTDGTHSAEATATIKQQMINKRIESVNASEKTITWQIDVNEQLAQLNI